MKTQFDDILPPIETIIEANVSKERRAQIVHTVLNFCGNNVSIPELEQILLHGKTRYIYTCYNPLYPSLNCERDKETAFPNHPA